MLRLVWADPLVESSQESGCRNQFERVRQQEAFAASGEVGIEVECEDAAVEAVAGFGMAVVEVEVSSWARHTPLSRDGPAHTACPFEDASLADAHPTSLDACPCPSGQEVSSPVLVNLEAKSLLES